MFSNSFNYQPLPERLEAKSDGYAGFVSPKNLDYFKYRGKEKCLLEQDEPAKIKFGGSILKNRINPAYKQTMDKIRPFYDITCDRIKSERLVEDQDDYEFNNDIIGRPTNIKIKEGFKKNEGGMKNTNTIGYNIGHTIGYTIGCAITETKKLKKAGSFFKAVWKPVKRSAQKLWKGMKNGDTEYIQFD
ncbi:uncharacterized protein LOC111642274 isoform X1 [Centruroides sculpturatus]|uniref:uncharacterized protein LOC111642274 isoform X1 n=1 Tax=Centruroides sculpturatus TaxID=218467 RepID=UPI000C6CFA73|nr:uncharacterized protein LOC111642274 isoform X1 [Centruroides sculpturatus]